eukprot:s2127_g3.t1
MADAMTTEPASPPQQKKRGAPEEEKLSLEAIREVVRSEVRENLQKSWSWCRVDKTMLITTYPLGMEDLGVPRNLLEGAADGVRVLVGLYPHRGQQEMAAHPADVLNLQSGASEQVPRQTRGEAEATHVFRARRALLPFLEEEARSATQQALQELDAWAAEYWGTEEVVETVDDGGDANAMGRPEPGGPLQLQPGRPELQPPLPPQTEGEARTTVRAQSPAAALPVPAHLTRMTRDGLRRFA